MTSTEYQMFSYDKPKSERHSFVLTVWYEPTRAHPLEGEWRGRVTRVETNEHRHLRDTEKVSQIVQSFLNEREVQLAN